jgi:hypothetical protein
MLRLDDGLAGRGTASVEVEEAGLGPVEDDRGDGVKIDRLTPTGWLGDPEILGAGITNCWLPPGTGLVAGTDSCCRRAGPTTETNGTTCCCCAN